MRFGERVRQLRQEKKLTLRGLAERVGCGFTYLSKVENERLDFADYPSDDLIGRLAKALDADEDELLLLAEKIPPQIKKRVLERPAAFRTLAGLDDAALDRVLEAAESPPTASSRKNKAARK
jgi:transcriptional regulator with XRE-family HTH domain